MPANTTDRWLESLYRALGQSRQRQLLTVQGSRAWCDRQLGRLLRFEPAAILISNRHRRPGAIAFGKVASCLGNEARLVLVDLFDGLDADVICIAAGMVRAGGVLGLLSAPPGQWDLARDRYACWQDGQRSLRAVFVEYFFAELERDPEIGLRLEPGSPPPPVPSMPRLEAAPMRGGMTRGQADILQRLRSWLADRSRGVALIAAARGRGKSVCLGLLAAEMGLDRPLLVTARSRQAAAQLLLRAPGVEFVAPDRLLRDRPAARLLIVDEAAAIPLPMLRGLCQRYPLLVMATTTAGYEGTGHGFMLRFAAELEERNLLRLRLDEPVRWCRHDRLEAWLDRCLMMPPETGGATNDQPPLEKPVSRCRLRLIENPGSTANSGLLADCYSLLCAAHYRTRPSELRILMENPDLLLVVAELEGRVVGVATLNREGGFDASLSEDIFLGRRRPRGHLLAQMLTAQAGCRNFATYRGLRVQRIAVATGYRRQGVGTRLIERALRYGRERGFDYLGASFALDASNANFWHQVGCRLLHVSFAAGKSSGDHSVAVLRPIAASVRPDVVSMRRRLLRQLPIWLTQFLQGLDFNQVTGLLKLADFRSKLDPLERDDVSAFAAGYRGFELSFASLQKFVMQQIAQGEGDPDPLLVEKAVQNRPWVELGRATGAEGRKQLLRRLRELVAALNKA